MKTLLLAFVLLLPQYAQAKSCLKDAWMFMMGEKLTANLNDLLETNRDSKKTVKTICSETSKNEMWNSERKELKKAFLKASLELKRNGKISSDYFAHYQEELPSGLTDDLICLYTDKHVKNLTSCYYPKNYLDYLGKQDFFNRDFQSLCQDLYPRLQKIYKDCRN